ncbi:MAG: PAS domain S-box protein [Actinobacteria bacterium]|nr:MAG: PAS domain S-box protein [Actinomycetota bacterium]
MSLPSSDTSPRGPALRTRVALTVVATVLLLGVLATVGIEAAIRDALTRAEEASGLTIGHNLAAVCVDPVLREDVVELMRLIRDVQEPEPGIVYVYVLDPGGDVLASTFAQGVPVDVLSVNRLRTGDAYRLQRIEADGSPVLDVGVPMLDGEAGAVHVGLSGVARQQTLVRTWLVLLFITAAAGVVGFVASLVAARVVTRPLTTLAAAAGRIRDGDLTARVEVAADRDLGGLASAFNEMAATLEADVLQFRADEEAVWASRQRYAALFGSINDGVFVVALDGTVLEVNDVALERLGYPRSEIVGEPISRVDSPEDAAHVPERLDALRERGYAEFESVHVRRDGSTFPVEVSSRVFDYGGTQAIVSIAHDITERKAAEQALRDLNAQLERKVRERTQELEEQSEELACMNEELRSANELLEETNRHLDEATRAKSEFLASMSHELRTPLNSIIGFSGVLLQGLAGPLDEEQRTQVGMINSAGKHLLDLVNEILDISKIEAGRLRLEFVEFDASDIVRAAVDTIRPLAEEKDLEVRMEIAEDLDGIVSDRVRVQQLLINLLGNAVKFTESGYVGLAARRQGGQVVFTVSDSGVGIAPENHARIFEEFYQVREPNGFKTPGTGLGLAVSLRLAEALGGRIEVASEVGAGSVFTMYLPTGRPASG